MTKNTMSDEELALQAQAGSRPSFEELVDRYSGRLYHFLLPKMQSGQDIEDILQEAFLKAYRNIDGYDPKWKFSTWIFTITNRLAIDHFRAQAKEDVDAAPEESEAGPEDQYAEKKARQNLWRKAWNLKPDYYKVLWMYYVQGMTNKEIAKVMGRTSLAVRMLVHRARLQLAEKLECENAEVQGSPSVENTPGFYYGGE